MESPQRLINSPKLPIIYFYLLQNIKTRILITINDYLKPFGAQLLYAQFYQILRMQQIIEQVTILLKLNRLDQAKEFQFIQKKTGIKPSAFVLAALVFLIIVTFISNATSLVVGIGCCCVPAYFTFVVLETGNKKHLKKYLIYWIIYAILEVLAIILIYLVPSTLYIVSRIGIAVALLHPDSSLAQKLFDELILPLLRKYEQDIDKNIQNALERGREGFKKGKQLLEKQIFND